MLQDAPYSIASVYTASSPQKENNLVFIFWTSNELTVTLSQQGLFDLLILCPMMAILALLF